MSKIIEKIKSEKLKSIVICTSVVIFIIGIVISITNTGNSYAASTYACFMCAGGSSYNSNYFWGSTPDSSNCTGSWTPTNAGTEEECLGYNVYIRYSVNGGTITTPVTDLSGETHNWQSVMMNGFHTIFDGKVDYHQNVRYRGKLTTDGLVNYNNKNFINITRSGYHVTSGSEWICLDGCTTENKVFSQTKQYNSSDFCNASSSDCSVLLGVNWQKNSTSCEFDTESKCEAQHGVNNCVKNSTTNCWEKKTETSCEFDTESKCEAQHGVSNCVKNSTTNCWEKKTETSCEFDTESKCEAQHGVSNCYKNPTTNCWEKNTSGSQPSPTYTITFNPTGGNVSQTSKTVSKNSTYGSLPTPTKTGYTFNGWYTSTSGGTKITANSTVSITANQTLYAQWTANTYTVIYDKNASDATGTTSNSTHTYDVAKALTANGYSRPNYTFKGWATTSSGTVVHTDKKVVSNLTSTDNATYTLFAVWEANNSGTPTTYTIKYDANGGKGAPASQTKTQGIQLTLSDTKPTRIGYTFLGWDTNSNSVNTTYKAGGTFTVDASTTLYAIWKANEYSIKYNSNNGTVIENPVIGRYDEVVTIKNPTKTVTIIGNSNKTEATISENITTEIKFVGWTSTTINKNTAYHGDTAWTDGNVKVTDTTFKNLTSGQNGIVTLIANWETEEVNLPTVSKDGYTCNWNTKADGKGTKYNSGTKYNIESESLVTINLYAECIANYKVDEEISTPPKTGDILILIAWIVGIGALGYAVYYFRSRKSNI